MEAVRSSPLAGDDTQVTPVGPTPPSAERVVRWTEDGRERTAGWRSSSGAPPPRRVAVGDDRMTADTVHRLTRAGTAVLWRGDFHGARQLLAALGRRLDRHGRGAVRPGMTFPQYRAAQAYRARTLGLLLVPFEPGHVVPLRRAPDVRDACTEAYGEDARPYLAPLRELQGVVGAHEWRRRGVHVPALDARVHPHHGVFAPVRGEYVRLVAEAPLSDRSLAFDVGTGTGVLAAVLARRGVRRVVATDVEPRAVACAGENLSRLGLADVVEVTTADLFPPGRAPLVVCNPPWLPGRPSSALEGAVYDPDGRMLHGFLHGLGDHLTPGGEGWLVLSDLAERLGLRPPDALRAAFAAAGLTVLGRLDARPQHPRARRESDPWHAARAAEVTSLWRLAAR